MERARAAWLRASAPPVPAQPDAGLGPGLRYISGAKQEGDAQGPPVLGETGESTKTLG